ncbi:MAG: response regulator [Candidatus Parcubacteria bacterium]|nr:response regulator [Candidatus Parcubacteria bacterium]
MKKKRDALKIFIVEDEPASIESAKMQLGKDHELIFFSTAMEVFEKLLKAHAIENERPDLILTDVNIPLGNPGYYDVKNHYAPGDMIPAGLVVALKAMSEKVPCTIVTDSNSHKDVIGLLLDDACLGNYYGPKSLLLQSDTRPERVDTPMGKGKDWAGACGDIKELITRLTATAKKRK